MSDFIDNFLAATDPQDLRNKLREQIWATERLQQKLLQVASLDEISSQLGEMHGDDLSVGLFRGEMRSVLLSVDNQMVVGGAIVVAKDAGKLGADAAASDTQIDFGKSMSPGDWIKLQGKDAEGNENSVEWMLVGALVGGTVYGVTRDVDGSGANAWSVGTPFAVVGRNGDHRIELVAGAAGELALITQGSTWDTYTIEASMSTVDGAIVAGGGNVRLNHNGISVHTAGLTVRQRTLQGGSVRTLLDGSERTIDDEAGVKTGEIQTDGDVSFGSDLAAPASSGFKIFSVEQIYNGELMGIGDILFGDNSPGRGNLLWDASQGQLYIRAGSRWMNRVQSGSLSAAACRVFKSSVQSLPDSAPTPIQFNVVHMDDLGFFSAAENTKLRIPPGYGGMYQILARVNFAGGATGYRQASISLNCSDLSASIAQDVRPGLAGGVECSFIGWDFLNEGDYVTLVVYQNNGAPLNANFAYLGLVKIR